MKNNKLICILSAYIMVFIFCSENINAGMWVGSNLVTNGNFSNGFSGWSNTTDFTWSSGEVTIQNGNDRTMTQSVSVETGKRYRVSGNSFAYKASHLAGQGWTRVTSTGISSTDWWTGKQSESFSYKSAEGISSGTSTSIQLTWDVVTYSMGIFFGGFDDIGLHQVIYDPQIDITEDYLELNAVSSLATAGLNLQDLSFADTPTNWWIDWGDGIIDYNPTLNALAEHTYDTSGGVMDYTATFYGENQAGNMMDTVGITIVPEPCSLILICGGCFFLRGKRK